MNTLHKFSAVGLAAALLAACSPMVSMGDIDYKSAQSGNPLEVPPDLTRISNDGRYAIPGNASANAWNAGQKVGKDSLPTAVNQVGDVQIKREGNQRWLVVNRAPGQLWDPVKTFWENSGFVLSSEDPKVGVMETDWAENRAKIPQDLIRSTIGKALDSLYSTGELDRFRTRMERNASGGTDIFISHRGMEEVLTGRDKSSTTWQARANDPGLEDEMLRRLMVALGVSKERAEVLLPAGKAQGKSAATTANAPSAVTNGVLNLSDSFDTAWRRVGLSLDRTGFTVEDRDQASGTYHVRYVPPVAPQAQEKPGLLSRLFSSKPEVKAVNYRVLVQPQSNGSAVRVLNGAGQAADAADSNRILKVLADDLKQR